MWKSGKYVAIALVGAGLAVVANAPASARGHYGYGGGIDSGGFHRYGPRAEATLFRPRGHDTCLDIKDDAIFNDYSKPPTGRKLNCLQEAHMGARLTLRHQLGIHLLRDHDLVRNYNYYTHRRGRMITQQGPAVARYQMPQRYGRYYGRR
jgi:hypothetical protein